MNSLPRSPGGENLAPAMQHALALAKRGFHVFPLEPGSKIPVITGYPTRATRNPEQIRQWWTCQETGWPHQYNIGISTSRFGEDKALVVIDVDNKNGKNGNDTLAQLELLGHDIPPTMEALTPTGGRHLFYVVPEPLNQRAAGALGAGLDLRSRGGYVVGPGSTVEAGEYRWSGDKDAAPVPAPLWLVEFCGKAPERPERDSHVIPGVDPAAARERGENYLKTAEPSIQGAGGHDNALRVLDRLLDVGNTPQAAADIAYHHEWNMEHNSPPFDHDELLNMIRGRPGSRQHPIGYSSPEVEFEPIEAANDEQIGDLFESKKQQTPPLVINRAKLRNIVLPKREWLLGKELIAQKVSVQIAAPGAGKSTYALQTAVALATGRDDICGAPVHKRGVVTVINGEDDPDEMNRRLCAIAQHFDVPLEAIEESVYVYSGVERPFVIAARRNTGEIYPVDKDAIIEHVRATGTRLLIVDPFLETHKVQENVNEEVNQVARMYREIALVTGCAVLILHHTRKLPSGSSEGHAGNMDSGRGASSLTGVARVMTTLYSMSEKDAKRYGIPEDMRHRYIRLDDAKANLSLVKPRAKWLKRVGVQLPNGDEVGVLEPVELCEVKEEARTQEKERRGRALADHIWGHVYRNEAQGKEVTKRRLMKSAGKKSADSLFDESEPVVEETIDLMLGGHFGPERRLYERKRKGRGGGMALHTFL